jgi:hypothetical protein
MKRNKQVHGKKRGRALAWKPLPTPAQVNVAFNAAQRGWINNIVADLNYLKVHADNSDGALLVARISVTSRDGTRIPLSAYPNIAFLVIQVAPGMGGRVSSATMLPDFRNFPYVQSAEIGQSGTITLAAILTPDYIQVSAPSAVYVVYHN